MPLKHEVYRLLEDEEAESPERRRIDALLAGLIVLSVVAMALNSVPEIHAAAGGLLLAIEGLCVLVFTIEYALRLWVAPLDRSGRYREPVRGRLRYALTPMAIIDLLAILPFFLELLLPQSFVFLRSLRILRLLKLSRYAPAMVMLETVVVNQRHALFAAFALLVIMFTLASGLMYGLEREAQPDAFRSIPAAMWWSVVTMTTVGYGDVTPLTPIGRVAGGVIAMLGILMFALPTAILGAGYIQEMQRRDFTRSAAMIAQVPLFRDVPPSRLAQIAGILLPRRLPARYTVMRRGEVPDSMYFIVKGRVARVTAEGRDELEAGGFFGETALLRGGRRHQTVITQTPCELLELPAADFHGLVEEDEELRRALERSDHPGRLREEGV